MDRINIIGAGLSGLSAALTLSYSGISCNLISLQPSERAQSVLAEGGINAALDTMGENDCIENHFNDTIHGGADMADPNAVDGLTRNAPAILYWLEHLGVPFNRKNGKIVLRNFGGQKKKRTAYAKSSTGKMMMTSLTDEARKYEAKGLITRYPHHEFIRLLLDNSGKNCLGVRVKDTYSGELIDFFGTVLLASGGINGVFPHMTTGTTQNSGDVTATVFSQGVRAGNLEMIQYHPTTYGISGKRCLLTEAARGEGGRLYVIRNGEPWYFMEEKYPELKNLMPRDVVSREIYFVRRSDDCENTVYLDMRELPEDTWKHKLSDLREEIIKYLSLDPKRDPIPIEPGIHYFMGGIDTDENHRTNIGNLYASGECTCQYHGANRLGGNSMLGAIYGGKKAAESILQSGEKESAAEPSFSVCEKDDSDEYAEEASAERIRQIREILLDGLGIVRNENEMQNALARLKRLAADNKLNKREQNRVCLARAMLMSALERKESRGAHYREDYPAKNDDYQKTTTASFENQNIVIRFRELPKRRSCNNENKT